MPTVQANGIEINYEVHGHGEPMVLIPYLAADQACYAFQVGEYEKHYTCYCVDLRGAGLSSKPEGVYSTELFAEDVAAFMAAVGIDRAHVFGVSLGASAGTWLAARHPERVKTLQLHSAWDKTDPFLEAIIRVWQVMAEGLGSVTEMVIQGIFPFCYTPEMYAARPDYVEALATFVRGRPMPPVDAFMRQSGAVLAHDATEALPAIQAPTLITYGRHDICTSTRFAKPLSEGIADSEVHVFENCAHAAIYEDVAGFNERTLHWLRQHSG
ncbi:MAG: alpha/beta fold hydrolase [Streptosporangiaceae bacterium]